MHPADFRGLVGALSRYGQKRTETVTGVMKIQPLNFYVNNKTPFSEEESSYAPCNPNIAPEAAATAPGGQTGTAGDAVPGEGAHFSRKRDGEFCLP